MVDERSDYVLLRILSTREPRARHRDTSDTSSLLHQSSKVNSSDVDHVITWLHQRYESDHGSFPPSSGIGHA